ncbi:hypothetical protein [Streptomyces sp. NPDC086010]|uniref:hypothetical protein n=1 Tax=Streptomyces sp. NPDC086010 TaxID=3365745 RepID=UPI0037D15140
MVKIFGALYLDGNKTFLPGRDPFREVVDSVAMFGYTEVNNAGFLAPARHPLLDRLLREAGVSYAKDEVSLYRAGLSWQGIDLSGGANLAHRLAVIERGGPFMVTRALVRAGWHIDPHTQHPRGEENAPRLLALPTRQLPEGSWIYQNEPAEVVNLTPNRSTRPSRTSPTLSPPTCSTCAATWT